MGSILDFKVKEEDDADSSSRRHLFRIYITGDTLVFDDIKEIPKRYSDINIALLHLVELKSLVSWLQWMLRRDLKCLI
jgi:hypothetical protein